MASLYERRRARLGMEDEEGMGVPAGGAMPTPEDENAVVSGAIETKLNQQPGAQGATPKTLTRAPSVNRPLSQKQPERDEPDIGIDAGADVETGVGMDAADLETGVDPNGATMEWRQSLGYGDQGNLIGFRTDGYEGDAEEANTVKNTFGKIASRYKNSPSMVDAMMADPDFQRAFPQARKVEGGANDKIDFGGVLSFFDHGEPVGVVDVLKASDPGADFAEGWTWQPEGGGGDAAMGGDYGGTGITASMEGLTESDQLAAILAQIDALANGGNAAETEALRRMLETGA